MERQEFIKLLDTWEKAYIKSCNEDTDDFTEISVLMNRIIDVLPFATHEQNNKFNDLVATFKDTQEVKDMALKIFDNKELKPYYIKFEWQCEKVLGIYEVWARNSEEAKQKAIEKHMRDIDIYETDIDEFRKFDEFKECVAEFEDEEEV